MGMDIDPSDNGGRNIKLNKVEFIDVDPLNRDSELNVAA